MLHSCFVNVYNIYYYTYFQLRSTNVLMRLLMRFLMT